MQQTLGLARASTNLGKVTKLVIGIEGSGSSGTLYFDDVRLYGKAAQYVTPTEPDTSSLLASYQFEGNANDSSGHGLNGAITDGQLVSPGKLGEGQAVQLNDAGYVDLGRAPSLDFGTVDWAVTAWYKNTNTGTGTDNKGTIFAKGGDNTGGHRYCLIMSETTEGVLSLVTDNNVTKYVVDSVSVTNDDEWHCVVGQRKGTALEIYIDGHLEGAGSVAATYNLAGTSQHNAYVGAITNHVDSSLYKLYIGLIDDVRVYNRALSDGEIFWLAGRTEPMAQAF
ncbi:MAG: LamG domain-containing protein [Phycisphaerae bacterium]|nr:LamG domain-containing protein [Phycisphaerae bacterium]